MIVFVLIIKIITLFNYFNHKPRLQDCIVHDVDSIRMKFIMNTCYIKNIK